MLLRSLKWSGLIIAALLLLTAAASIRFALDYHSRAGWSFTVRHGAASLRWHSDPDDGLVTGFSGWRLVKQEAGVRWWPEHNRWPVGTLLTIHQVHLPLWILVLLIGAPAAWLWWRDRPRPPYACQRCGYDLRGVSAGAGKQCPECGDVRNGPSRSDGVPVRPA